MRGLLFLVLLLPVACINSRSESGVANTWRGADLPAFEPGRTTQAEVAKALGPPSQLVDLGGQVVFYYLAERAKNTGVILILYNTTRERVVYDRAIFFFDKKGLLEDYAFSLEEVDYKPPAKPKGSAESESPSSA
ncbi:MAG: hypothetical protein ACYS0E_08430 [Planctomycetota bacterium]